MNIRTPAFPPPSNASVILPDELIIEILSRLNVKSLFQLKCVCKSWNTLISDPNFVKLHLKRSKQNLHLAFYTSSNIVATISVSHFLESTSNSITLTDDRYFRFNYNYGEGIVGSCNGLICLHSSYRYWPSDHFFCFWNPATRTKSETLSSPPWSWSWSWSPELKSEAFRFGFGYDNSTDKYKAVRLGFNIYQVGLENQVRTTTKVFTLGGSIWRDIQNFPVGVVPDDDFKIKYDGVYLRNSISWLVRKVLTIEQLLIISFDLGTETFTQLLLPSCCDELPLDNRTLCVLKDSICFSHDFKGTHFVIWQMKEFGVEDSWTQFLKISYLNLEINYELSDYGFQLLQLCLSENGATLILVTTSPTRKTSQAILYNLRDNRVKKKIVKTDGISWLCVVTDYVESLVSTC